jgi:high-affinity iron transporter
MTKKIIFIVLVPILINEAIFANDNEFSVKVRSFISLLDYLRTDYQNAVNNGKVINETEYAEMLEFIERANSLFNDFAEKIDIYNRKDILTQLGDLKKLIQIKGEHRQISKLSNQITEKVLKLNIIPVSPSHWPSIIKGEKIFKTNCVSCHGPNGKGDGILSKDLNPKPRNFLNDTVMNNISPLQIYNTVKLGISGTSMPPFNNLKDEELWDVAFYVSALRYKNKYKLTQDSLSNFYNEAIKQTSLYEVATKSDNLLLESFTNSSRNDSLLIASLRLYNAEPSKVLSINIASFYLDKVLSFYKSNSLEKANDFALKAYLEGVEPFEGQLKNVNSKLKDRLEEVMFKIRTDINNKVSYEIIETNIRNAKELISEAESELKNQKFTFWFTFSLAASIIIREGIEAFLIIVTILSILKSIGADKAEKWVHFGWISALFIGVTGLFFINALLAFGARSRELLEGTGSLFAVFILLYVGFWLHNKSEAKKWKEFVENKILKLVNGKKMFGLAIISFIVVFREAFESVIFMSAISLEADNEGIKGIYWGTGLTLIFILFLSWIVIKFSVRLPIGKLFKISALTILMLAIILTGKGIHAFQESGYLNNTPLLSGIKIELLGIYPTLESLLAQFVVLLLTIIYWNYSNRVLLKA